MNENNFAHMEFLERGTQPTEAQTTEKRITREEFRSAMHAAAMEIVKDPECEGEAKFMIPITGMVFARKNGRNSF